MLLKRQQLTRCLYVRHDVHKFNDGSLLYPGFGDSEDKIRRASERRSPGRCCFLGQIALDMGLYDEDVHEDMPAAKSTDLLVLGQEGQFKSVRQRLLELNRYCHAKGRQARTLLPI